jgi:3',5'-cyclic AMP phosphodiesterase CpdA
VRTINALHRKDPIAFTLLGGDNADSAQTNEFDWVLGMLSGSAYVKCDSGDVSDPIPGPANDGKDAFAAEGLAMPWKWMTGNHDVLVQGNFPIVSEAAFAIGKHSEGGTRNYAKDPNGAIQTGDFVVADPARALLDRQSLMAKVAADKDGHGIGDAEKASGRATYTFDVDGTPIRFVVLDTTHTEGGSEGVITQSQLDTQIRGMLDQAKAAGKWVILASHHATDALTNGGTIGSTKTETDALTPDAWVDFVSSNYPNVLFSMVGHAHRHRVAKVGTKHAWWEVMTAAIADWPNEFRLVELFDQENGWLMMRATCMDFATDGDPVAAEGKRRATSDETTGWAPAPNVELTDRNVELWIKKP